MNKAIRKKFDKVWSKFNQTFNTPDYNIMARFIDRQINFARRCEFLRMKLKNTESMVKFQISVHKQHQDRFEEMHKYLNWIMDSSVMYDENILDMANNAIKANRQWATEARTILRRVMK